MKTAVDAIFVGKDRAYNRRFQQICGHYLVDPVAWTPASGWEKGKTALVPCGEARLKSGFTRRWRI